jgi:hypothetical protein
MQGVQYEPFTQHNKDNSRRNLQEFKSKLNNVQETHTKKIETSNKAK